MRHHDPQKAIRLAHMIAKHLMRGGYEDGGTPTADDPLTSNDIGGPSPADLINAQPSPNRSRIDDALSKVNEYTAPRMEDYQRGAEGPASLTQAGIENMKSGDWKRMLLGAGQDVLGTLSTPFAPLSGAIEAAKGSAERTFGPAAGHAVDVASMVNPDVVPAALAKVAHYTPELAMAGMGMKASNSTVDLAKDVIASPRVTNDVGLYSHGAEAAANLPQMKGTPQQFRAMLEKQGVKPAEFENSGYDQAFAGKNIVTKDDVAQHFQNAMPQVEETVLGKTPDAIDAGRALAESHGNNWDELSLADQNRYIRKASDRNITEYADDPKFEQYTLPGGENYREVLLKLPSDARVPTFEEWFNKTHISSLENYADNPRMMEILRNKYNAEVNNMPKEVSFQSSHWDDPNVLAHLRMADRTGPNGEKILHVEEIQSDWGQQGKKRGFAGEKEPDQNTGNWQVIHESDRGPVPYSFRSEQEANDWAKQLRDMGLTARDPIPEIIPGVEKQGTLPSAPYVTNTQAWTDLALKRALKEAAEGGYDKLVWTPGAEQAKRYDLSKQISRLVLEENKDGGQLLRAYSPSGDQVISKSITNPEKELPDLVGKEVSEKLLAQEPLNPKRFNENLQPNDITVVPKENRYQISAPWGWSTHVGKGTVGSEKEAAEYAVNYFNKMAKEANSNLEYQGPVRALEGQELSVGGEGMKGYYDKILPGRLKELTKKLDPDSKIELNSHQLPTGEKLHSLEITPLMRERIKKGLPAFKRGGMVARSNNTAVDRALALVRALPPSRHMPRSTGTPVLGVTPNERSSKGRQVMSEAAKAAKWHGGPVNDHAVVLIRGH